MILGCIKETCLYPSSVSHNQTISGCTIVVCCRESLNVQPAKSTCCKYHSLSLYNIILLCLKVIEYRAPTASLPVKQEFHSRGELHNIYTLPVSCLIPYHTHDLRTCHITSRVHPLSTCAPTVSNPESAVWILVKHHAKVFKPVYYKGCIIDECSNKLWLVGKVPTTNNIEVVIIR